MSCYIFGIILESLQSEQAKDRASSGLLFPETTLTSFSRRRSMTHGAASQHLSGSPSASSPLSLTLFVPSGEERTRPSAHAF